MAFDFLFVVRRQQQIEFEHTVFYVKGQTAVIFLRYVFHAFYSVTVIIGVGFRCQRHALFVKLYVAVELISDTDGYEVFDS